MADCPADSLECPERRGNRKMTARCEIWEVGRHSKRDKEKEEEEACERRGWKVTSVSKGCCCEQQLLWVTVLKSWETDRKRSIVRAKTQGLHLKNKTISPVILVVFFKVNIALLLLRRIKKYTVCGEVGESNSCLYVICKSVRRFD